MSAERPNAQKKRKRMEQLIEKGMQLDVHSNGAGDRICQHDASVSNMGNDASTSAVVVRKTTWSAQEDAALVELVQQYGRDWAAIATRMSARDRVQCRKRYVQLLDPMLSRAPWTQDEDARLLDLQTKLGNAWTRIASSIHGRSADDVKNRWRRLQRDSNLSSDTSTTRSTDDRWTDPEIQRLRYLVDRHGAKDWLFIASHLPGRTDLQCRQQWFRVVDPSIRKGAWSKEEDRRLLEQVATLGMQWTQIAQELPGRIDKQCRERYWNHLHSNISKTPWTQQEDAILRREVDEHGSRWSEMTGKLPGRSANAIKNHWNSMLACKPQLITPVAARSDATDLLEGDS